MLIFFTSLGFARTVFALNSGNIRDLLHVQESSDAGEKALAKSRVAGDDMGVFALLDVLDEERGVVLGKALNSRKEDLSATWSRILHELGVSFVPSHKHRSPQQRPCQGP